MRRVERYYDVQVDGRHHSYREAIADVVESDWLSPAEAERMLNEAGAETPFPRRQYLVWRAGVGLLPSKAEEIVEEVGSGDDGAEYVYEQMPLLEEWQEDAWASPHADFWVTGNLRMVRRRDSMRMLVTFRNIAFERAGIETVVELYSQVANGDPIPTGDPGRPTKGRELYMVEFERRAAAGLAKSSAKLEAQDLQDWFRIHHAAATLPTAKTIENNIRPRMRALSLLT